MKELSGPPQADVVLTIGHSTRTLETFIQLLTSNRVATLVDIRTIPRSRHNPQFNGDTLPASLSAAGIGYRHMPGLGGLRRPRPDSPNLGWLNSSFRGFADYMQTPEFETNLQALIALSQQGTIVLMCAEAVPWRCHRSLIADALLVRGIPVEHIISGTSRRVHTLTSWAQVTGNRITYPPQTSSDAPPQQQNSLHNR